MENHHFLWENPLFLWQFSIAILTSPEGKDSKDPLHWTPGRKSFRLHQSLKSYACGILCGLAIHVEPFGFVWKCCIGRKIHSFIMLLLRCRDLLEIKFQGWNITILRQESAAPIASSGHHLSWAVQWLPSSSYQIFWPDQIANENWGAVWTVTTDFILPYTPIH